jgi:ring-1,2-phenylacetyl-CoA epoxidase subunit PaaD
MTGEMDRRAAVIRAANSISDPCGSARGIQIGLVDMGIVHGVEVSDGHVSVQLTPTFPGCLFIGLFEDELRTRLEAMPWCTGVTVELSQDGYWDETSMTPSGRRLLRQARPDQTGPAAGGHVRAPGVLTAPRR